MSASGTGNVTDIQSSLNARSDGSCFPLLLADMGGTHVRLAWIERTGDKPRDVVTLRAVEHAGPAEAIAHYLDTLNSSVRPKAAALALATAITGDVQQLTNLSWTVDRHALIKRFRWADLRLFNDFEALAMSLPFLSDTDFRLIGSEPVHRHRAMALIGPGTGLGVSSIFPLRFQPGVWQVVAGEGGHATLSAGDAFEAEVIDAARAVHGHVSCERLLSGMGLPTLYAAVAAVCGLPFDKGRDARDIADSALEQTDALSVRTLEVFCALLGGMAGNLALTVGARGALFIGGGIVPRWGDFIDRSLFRQRFESKGRFEGYLRPIGTALITAPFATLDGLAQVNAFPGQVAPVGNGADIPSLVAVPLRGGQGDR